MHPSPAQNALAGGFAALGAALLLVLAVYGPESAERSLWLAIPLVLCARARLAQAQWLVGAEGWRRLGLGMVLVLAAGLVVERASAWIWPMVIAPDRLYPVLMLAAMVVGACLLQWKIWPALGLLFQAPLAEPADSGLPQRLNERSGQLCAPPDAYWRYGFAISVLQLLLLCLPLCLPAFKSAYPSGLTLLVLAALLLVLSELLWRTLATAARQPLPETGVPSFLLDGNPDLPPADEGDPEDLSLQDAGPDADLLAAARRGDAPAVRAALEAGAAVESQPAPQAADQRSPLVAAATAADLGALRALIAAGAKVDRIAGGLTALLAATRDSYSGRIEAVMTLLANGANPNVCDGAGNSPLHFAAATRDPGIAQSLLDAGAQIDAVNREGMTPLALACESSNWSVAEFLLKRGAKVDVDGATPPLLFAAAVEGDDARGAKLLLKARAKVNACGPLGRSALMVAALADNAEIADALLAAGADINARDDSARSALMEAARAGAKRVLTRLVFHKPDTTAVDTAERDALHLAVAGGNADVECVRLLLALGLDADRLDGQGRRAVDIAAAAGRWPLVRELDPDYPLPSSHLGQDEESTPVVTTIAPDPPGKLLVRAALQGRFPLYQDLLGLPGMASEDIGEALCAALPHQDRRYVDALFDSGIDPYARSGSVTSLYEQLCLHVPLPRFAIEVLLDHAARFETAAAVLLPGLCAIRDDTLEAAIELRLLDRALAAGADAAARDVHGTPVLLLALRQRSMAYCERLLGDGIDLESAVTAHDNPLLTLAWARRADALELAPLLIRTGADPARGAVDGSTPAAVAGLTGQSALAPLLAWPTGAHPRTPLDGRHVAEAGKRGDLDTLDRLLGLGLDVDGLDEKGASALLHAAGTGRVELVGALIDRGANPQLASARGIAPAAAAILAGRSEVLDLLLARGLPMESVLLGRLSILGLAAACLRVSLVDSLLSRGADANGKSAPEAPLGAVLALVFDAGKPLLQIQAVVERLLLGGASPDHPDADARSPLHRLVGAGRNEPALRDEARLKPILSCLLRAGANANALDREGRTPLHWVCRHGLVQCGGVLLEYGADPRIPDESRRLPIDLLSPRARIHLGPILRQAAEAWNRQRDPRPGG